jgi:prolyl oligopeptidase
MLYPKTHKIKQLDDYHGTLISDPYRWLEDLDSTETKAWIREQNQLSCTYLNSISAREFIKQRARKLFDYTRYTLPINKSNRYFYKKNIGLNDHSTLYYTIDLEQEPIVLIDSNDSSNTLLRWSVSENGEFLAYSTSVCGSDWQEWRVKNVSSGQDLDDHLKWSKFSNVSWTHDNIGFFYCRYDEPDDSTKSKDLNYFQKLFFHRLGTLQVEDELVYERLDEKEWLYSSKITENGRYLIISVWENVEPKNLVFYKDLSASGGSIIEIVNNFDDSFEFVGNDNDILFFLTDSDAPRGRLIAIDIANPAQSNWQQVIPQANETLRSVKLLNDHFIATYIQNAYTFVKVFTIDGIFVRSITLPALGTVENFSGSKSNAEIFFSFSSFYIPNTIYKYDLSINSTYPVWQTSIDFNFHEYETKQVFYNSKDGTSVPMFITHKKNLKLDGTNPTYLYGYGGFNASLTPRFSLANLIWMEMGGVFAVANIRGGGEYGREWHRSATKLNKQRTFDDFISAAEWLIDNSYTSTQKLAIGGRSNGGLLVGACMTQRPDLFGAAIPEVGGMDMLRFDKFTIGWSWVCDYGSPDNPEEFKALYAYSPLHNVKDATLYPTTLIVTSSDDDRVVPSHSYKFAAALQEAQASSKPILLRVYSGSGHGAGKSAERTIEEIADRWSFLTQSLSMEVRLYK